MLVLGGKSSDVRIRIRETTMGVVAMLRDRFSLAVSGEREASQRLQAGEDAVEYRLEMSRAMNSCGV
jgi:hypothetical protein